LSYEWRFNGTNIAGAVTNIFTITNVQSSDVGIYSVLVSNSVGTVISASAYAVVVSNTSGAVTTSNATLVVNHIPVALPDTFNRLIGLPFTIRIADVLANDSDLDGDPLTIIGLSENSANGALVDRDTTFIYYTPPETNTNALDQFTYTISDGRGRCGQRPRDNSVCTAADSGGFHRLGRFHGPFHVGRGRGDISASGHHQPCRSDLMGNNYNERGGDQRSN
jgi:Cadherin-like domain